MESKTSDNVNHPAHYTDGKIEVIDYIDDKKLSFCLGNAVKYISRAGKKDTGKTIEDLQKAAWYINHEIELLKEFRCVFHGRCLLYKKGLCVIPIYNGTTYEWCFENHGKKGIT